MASGRLGKAEIAPLSTTVVYHNTSGAEAAVSIIAQSDSASMDLRIDDSSDPLEATTTIANEVFSPRYIRLDMSNTDDITTTSSYLGRYQFKDTTTTTNVDHIFEYYDNTTSTLYTRSDVTFYNSTTLNYPTFDVFSLDSPNYILIPYGGDFYLYNSPSNRLEYYDLTLDGTIPSNWLNYSSAAYSTAGMATDPYEKGKVYGISIDNTAYLDGVMNTTGTALHNNNVTGSNSIARFYGITSLTNPTASAQYPRIRISNRMYVIDGCNNIGRIVVVAIPDSSFSSNNAAYLVNKLYLHSVYNSNTVTNANGGIVLYFEYNPNNDRWYLGYRNNGVIGCMSFNRDNFISNVPINSSNSFQLGTSDITKDIINETISLPLSTFSASTSDVTFRSNRVGESLWVLAVSQFNNTTAPEIFYSTDLKTWVSAANFYAPYDYNSVDNAKIIRSNSGVITETVSNIYNLGKDGVLENNVPFNQYERTGLLLNNGDRIVAHNSYSSTSNISIQVMGYEGS